ncbi:hypothetical protein L1887_57424 [Cichorium endivia]|nr:hypothetical protein L1887_57424 [Cichorium endivia]
MHLLDKRSTRALPVAAMIHDNSTIARPSCRRRIIQISALSTFDVQSKSLNEDPLEGKSGASSRGNSSSNSVCTGLLVPSVGDALLALNWPGRASGAVTLKKLECSKQAYALYTLAWDNIIGFRSYYVGLRDRSNDKQGQSGAFNPVNHRVFERKLRPKPSGRGHACLGVTHRVAPNHASLIGTHGIGAEIGLPCLWCGWPKLESPSVDARLVVVEKTLVLCRAS